jgi:hypothetical protein
LRHELVDEGEADGAFYRTTGLFLYFLINENYLFINMTEGLIASEYLRASRNR